jgi:DNA polymerase-4
VRRPKQIECLYLDFDGFFASVEQTVHKELRGLPVGVVPFAGTDRTCVIAVSREAKLHGIGNAMPVNEARALCPDIVLVPQSPDLYRRAHNALLSEISAVLPIDAVKSIDELTCRVEPSHRADPLALGLRLKERIAAGVGPYITCSIGFAANRQLAKMACKAGKRVAGRYGDGNNVWHPDEMPAPLLGLALDDIPGVGKRMLQRLTSAGVATMAALLATQPKHMRALWGNVNGERLWYALHGYEVHAPPSSRGMYGHGRVLPPDARAPAHARTASRLLLVKAARRMRRDGWNAGRLTLWLSLYGKEWGRDVRLPAVHDDQAVLAALEALWKLAHAALPRSFRVVQVGVTLSDITRANERQLDILLNDDVPRRKWESTTAAIDGLNRKYGRTLVSVGPWTSAGEFAGGKISYTRIPRAEDFW